MRMDLSKFKRGMFIRIQMNDGTITHGKIIDESKQNHYIRYAAYKSGQLDHHGRITFSCNPDIVEILDIDEFQFKLLS